MDDRPRYDLIGDVHGCLDEALRLLAKLGYSVTRDEDGRYRITPPLGRRAVFLGDLVNRGPQIPGLLRLVMDMADDGGALCVRGNHDFYLLRRLQGANVLREFGPTYGRAAETSVSQLDAEDDAFVARVTAFLEGLPPYLILDDGRLVAAHAGLPVRYQRKDSAEARDFAVFGPKEGDAVSWPQDYKGKALVVYGHYARPDVRWSKNAVCLDTGCLYGGRLTALRYPELEMVSVEAARVYYESAKFNQRAKAKA